MKKKFDFVISNPPYQDDTSGNKTFAPPVYNKIMEAAFKIADKAAFITPARFLFDAGATPKDFNQRMLNDPHLKVLDYAPDARKYFKGVDIEGGVAITFRDETQNFGAIGIYTPFEELNSLHKKVCVDNKNFRPLTEIIFGQTVYRLTKKFHEDNPEAVNIISKGHANDFSTVLMKRFSKLFFDTKPADGNDYIQVHGRVGTERVCKYFRSDWVTHPAPFDKWKILVPTANGSGAFGEVYSTPLIGLPILSKPFFANTETFITVGAFDTLDEAEACLKYIKSKFARAMLGILKVTQHATPDKWAKVPLQDFTATSDINWDLNVDEQLYRKYNLSETEIKFIETHVKEMI
ncbi:MAG: Eco57I restriction-modification methylase domain-containing protein [Selenomonadaceae bacterium]|nr:Eco57I restriction-modification methylase domain-containing protein [Selenomonadaceae bacterium]